MSCAINTASFFLVCFLPHRFFVWHKACVWSGSCVEEAWSVVEEAERAEVSFGSKDLLDARLILAQVHYKIVYHPF